MTWSADHVLPSNAMVQGDAGAVRIMMGSTDRNQPQRSMRELPDLPDISFIILPGVDRGFTDEREIPEHGIVEYPMEPVVTDGSHTDVLMPIQPAPQCTF